MAQNHVLIDHRFFYSLQVVPIHLATDDLDELFVSLKLHLINSDFVHLIDDTFVVWSQYLCTVFPICLIAVILFGIMRCRNVHTSLAAELTNGK